MCEIKKTKTEKFKEVTKSVWDRAKKPLALGVLVFGAFMLGDRYSQVCCASGMKSFHIAGAFKFFDPATGLEVPPEEAVKIIEKIAAGLKA